MQGPHGHNDKALWTPLSSPQKWFLQLLLDGFVTEGQFFGGYLHTSDLICKCACRSPGCTHLRELRSPHAAQSFVCQQLPEPRLWAFSTVPKKW